MINFHKYAFLDCKKLRNYIADEEFWLCNYSPIWLFIWSDLYKPEICFSNDFCYIRFLMPEVGICYYPPLGKGDKKRAYVEIVEDAKENGFDFYMGPFEESMLKDYRHFGFELMENPKFASYTYSCDALSFYNGKEYKDKRKRCLQFEKTHPNAFYRKIKKEDFPSILEFMTEWNSLHKDQYNTPYFYNQLNMIKKCIDHLYELDLIGIVLADEKKIYGFALGSIQGNLTTVHINLALTDTVGAEEELMQCFARTVTLKTRYLSMEMDSGDPEVHKKNMGYRPSNVEKFYATFSV